MNTRNKITDSYRDQNPPFGLQTGVFFRLSHLFFGSPNEVNPIN